MTRSDKLCAALNDNEGVLITSYPNIFYYSGFTTEDAVLLITKTRRILVTDSRYTVQAHIEAKDFEIHDITEKLDVIVRELDVEVLGFEEKSVTISQFAMYQKLGKKLIPMQEKISGLRRIKDDSEIAKIKAAEELGDAAFLYTVKNMHAGMTEREVALMLEFYMRKNCASRTSFDTIVASGVRSSMPHGVASNKVIEDGDFVTMDFGCVLDGYCSDMTRTIVVGHCSEKQREIYDIVLKAQTSAISQACAGKKCADIDKAARDIIESAGYGKNFGHSLGHSVGIEIHEMPCFAPKSHDVAQKNNVITVEPGIYIENFGGVRIEDIIVIGETAQNLTKSAKELIII